MRRMRGVGRMQGRCWSALSELGRELRDLLLQFRNGRYHVAEKRLLRHWRLVPDWRQVFADPTMASAQSTQEVTSIRLDPLKDIRPQLVRDLIGNLAHRDLDCRDKDPLDTHLDRPVDLVSTSVFPSHRVYDISLHRPLRPLRDW
jgi:hypothetical protein